MDEKGGGGGEYASPAYHASSSPSRTRLAASSRLRSVRICFGSASTPGAVRSCNSAHTLPRLLNTCSNSCVSSLFNPDEVPEPGLADRKAETGVTDPGFSRMPDPGGVKIPDAFTELFTVKLRDRRLCCWEYTPGRWDQPLEISSFWLDANVPFLGT